MVRQNVECLEVGVIITIIRLSFIYMTRVMYRRPEFLHVLQTVL